MLTKEELEKKILSLKAYQVVDLMIKAIEKPVTDVVYMPSYILFRDNLCYGCASTNLLMKLGKIDKKSLNKENYGFTYYTVCEVYYNNSKIIINFETAIDRLRIGNIEGFNRYGNDLIPVEFLDYKLPCLTYDIDFKYHPNYKEYLDEYRKFSKLLKEHDAASRN